MPSHLEVPTVQDFIKAYRNGIHGIRRPNASLESGYRYNIWGGVAAVLFHREAVRDRDLFRSIFFSSAGGDDLVDYIEAHYGVDPILKARGEGLVRLERASVAAGSGTLLAGTRIEVWAGGADGPKIYRIKSLVDPSPLFVGATQTVASVVIEPELAGIGFAMDSAISPPKFMRIVDPLWDNSWRATYLVCADGTDREKDPAYRARALQDLEDRRPGYIARITDAMVEAGASQVALFASDFISTNPTTGIESIGELDADGYGDVGLNRVYVGDASFVSTDALLRACRLKLDDVAIAGTDVQILPMAPATVAITATIRFWDDPGNFDTVGIKKAAQNAVINYFRSRQNAFYFRNGAAEGAILNSVKDIQSLVVTSSPGEPALATLFNASPLLRYGLDENAIAVTLLGPA